MDKVRISEVAKEAAKKSKDVLIAAEKLGIEAKAASSSVSVEDAGRLFEYLMNNTVATPSKEKTSKPATKKKSSQSTQKESSKDTKKPTRARKTSTTKQPKQSKKEDETLKEANKSKEKEESKKPTPVRQRRKLIIVKKKNPKNEATEQTEKSSQDSSEIKAYGKTKVAADIANIEKKKKKPKTKSTPTKKVEAIKLDVFNDISMSDTVIDDTEDSQILPDFTYIQPKEDSIEEQAKKKRINDQRPVTQRAAKFQTIQTISRVKKKKKKRPAPTNENQTVKSIEISEDARVYEFAEKINRPTSDVIKELFSLGIMVTKNDFLEKDYIEVLAEAFEVEVNIKNDLQELDYVSEYEEKVENKNLKERPPIVTIMGHVDHGKTSLLDAIRDTKVTDKEAGGITQHIGAYTVSKDGKEITFVDTPGHEAFTHMRARGANVTDVVIIVVAADDGVMPQTVEAINHAKAADVPIIVAINKIDKPQANIDMVKSGLAENGLTPVDWGGDIECIGVSAKTKEGLDDLLETILLQAEILELKADPTVPAKAVIIESSLEKGRGAVATLIVQNGTLKKGDTIIAGTSFGRVRAITDDMGRQIKELKPSEAGEILGLDSVPGAGDIAVVVKNEKEAREIATKRKELARQKELSKTTKATLDELTDLIKEGQLNKLPIVLKADVQGTLEALVDSLEKLRNEEVKTHIIHSAVGAISESDVVLAGASEHAIVLGFNVKPTTSVKNKAKELGVEIKTYSVIYDLLEDVKAILGGMLSPELSEEEIGKVEIRQIFNVPKLGVIAGSMVIDGIIKSDSIVRIYRGEDEIYKGKVISLKRFKDDVKEVKKGYDCGIGVEDFTDFAPGDVIVAYKQVEVTATFNQE